MPFRFARRIDFVLVREEENIKILEQTSFPTRLPIIVYYIVYRQYFSKAIKFPARSSLWSVRKDKCTKGFGDLSGPSLAARGERPWLSLLRNDSKKTSSPPSLSTRPFFWGLCSALLRSFLPLRRRVTTPVSSSWSLLLLLQSSSVARATISSSAKENLQKIKKFLLKKAIFSKWVAGGSTCWQIAPRLVERVGGVGTRDKKMANWYHFLKEGKDLCRQKRCYRLCKNIFYSSSMYLSKLKT